MYGGTTISVDELGPPVSPSSPWPCGRGATALRERRGRRRSRWPRSAGTPGSRRHKPRAAVDGVLVDACCPGPGPRTVASAQVPEVLVHIDGHANVAWARSPALKYQSSVSTTTLSWSKRMYFFTRLIVPQLGRHPQRPRCSRAGGNGSSVYTAHCGRPTPPTKTHDLER